MNVRDDEGATSGVWLMFMLIVVFAAAGLIFDGGRAMQAERYASTVASGAARSAVASQQLARLTPTGGIDIALATAAAIQHSSAAGIPASDVAVTVDGADVRVVVTVRRTAVFTALVGRSQIVSSAAGSARFIPTGVTP